jgi:CO/xanthine dehydrogenase Mo-binding subunit
VRAELAEIFGVTLQQVRVVVPYIGGAYGSKCYTKYEPLASYLAREVGRPVRLTEDPFHTLTRHAARIRIKSGVKLDGTITAREAEILLDTGAYSDIGPRVANKTSYRTIGPYRIPHVRSRAVAVFTNKVPSGAFRGYGAPQGQWAVESHMDLIAEALQLDPLAFRLQNLVSHGERWNPKDTPIDGEFREGLRWVADRIGWPGGNMGLAVAVKDGGGRHTIAQATVRVHHDGTATVQVDAVEMGQGSRTVLGQIAAETLGLPFESVHVTLPDTDVMPWDQGVSASRGTTVVGKAVWEAARACRERLAAEGLAPDAAGEEALGAVVRGMFGMPGGEVVGHGIVKPGSFGPGATTYWEAGFGAAEVAVDEETGVIRVERYVTAADVGIAINPETAEGQDHGAALMGIGHSLFEELQYQDGQLVNGNLVEYRVPTFSDLPEDFESHLIENGDGPGPFGCKGVGESGIIPVAPAIANAVARACGVRLFDLPLTPERVWRALRHQRELSRS